MVDHDAYLSRKNPGSIPEDLRCTAMRFSFRNHHLGILDHYFLTDIDVQNITDSESIKTSFVQGNGVALDRHDMREREMENVGRECKESVR